MLRHTGTFLLTLILSALPCFADTFAWSYTGEGVTASGTFITGPLTDGAYEITSISGQRNGQLITGLSTFGLANQLLYLDFPYFDYAGLSFVAGGIEINIYGTFEHGSFGVRGLLTEAYIVNPGWQLVDTELTTFTLTRVTEIPEPASIVLLSTGLVGLGYKLRKRRAARAS